MEKIIHAGFEIAKTCDKRVISYEYLKCAVRILYSHELELQKQIIAQGMNYAYEYKNHGIKVAQFDDCRRRVNSILSQLENEHHVFPFRIYPDGVSFLCAVYSINDS